MFFAAHVCVWSLSVPGDHPPPALAFFLHEQSGWIIIMKLKQKGEKLNEEKIYEERLKITQSTRTKELDWHFWMMSTAVDNVQSFLLLYWQRQKGVLRVFLSFFNVPDIAAAKSTKKWVFIDFSQIKMSRWSKASSSSLSSAVVNAINFDIAVDFHLTLQSVRCMMRGWITRRMPRSSWWSQFQLELERVNRARKTQKKRKKWI